jgi:hypothetical protein
MYRYSSISCFVNIYFCVMCIMSCLKIFRTVQCVSISCFKDISAVQCVVYFSLRNLLLFDMQYIQLRGYFTAMSFVAYPFITEIYYYAMCRFTLLRVYLLLCYCSVSMYQDFYCHGMRFYILLQGYLCFASKRKLLK